jgi:hypothetical protein
MNTKDEHEAKKGKAERQEIVALHQLEPVEQPPRLAGLLCAKRPVEPEKRPGRACALEALALDALVDDRLGQVERNEIERQRDQHEEQDHDLLWLAVPPDVFEKIGFHGMPAFVPLLRLDATGSAPATSD